MNHKTPSGFDLEVGEEVIWYGRRSWKSMVWSIIGLSILLIFFVILGAVEVGFILLGLVIFGFGIIGVAIKVIATEYVITDQRVSSRFGLIGRKTNEGSFERIQDTEFQQGWGGRLLDYGDIGIRTAGTKGTEINFRGISEPKRIQRMLRDMIKRFEEDREIEERIKRFEDKYLIGEITKEEFEEVKQKLRARINREDKTTPVTPGESHSNTPSRSTPSQTYEEETKDQSLKTPPPELKKEEKLCPQCHKDMRYIEQYERWYCDNCEEYK